jgi:hypothetical protein
LNLSTILSLAALQYPNSVSQPNSLIFLNECQNTLYRKFDFPEKSEVINLQAGTCIYDLPSDCVPERVRNVVVINPSGQVYDWEEDDESDDSEDQEFPSEYDVEGSLGEYVYCEEHQEMPGNCYGIINSSTPQIILFPMPSIPNTFVGNVFVTYGGLGYTSTPTVTITGGGCITNATATAVVSGGVITSLSLTSNGAGYSTAPTVTISGGGGTGASGYAVLSGLQLVLTYSPGANDLTTGNLTIVPMFSPDYHMYFVHKLSAWYAKLARDVNMNNNFEADADEIYNRALSDMHYGQTQKLLNPW